MKADGARLFLLHARALGGGLRCPGGFEDLDPAALWAMCFLTCEDGLTASELARRLSLDESTLSHVLREPRVRGLVESRPNGRENRQWLTPEGHRLVDAWLKPYLEVLAESPPQRWLALGPDLAQAHRNGNGNSNSNGRDNGRQRSNGRPKR